MEITPKEVRQLQATIDFMEDAITDIVGWANDPSAKLRSMHEVKRIHELASNLLEDITLRDQPKIQALNIRKKPRFRLFGKVRR